jgi:hypothetical protein
MNKNKIILSGKIFENNLINFPQYLLMNSDNRYKLLIGNPYITFLIQVTETDKTLTIPVTNNNVEIIWRG